MNNKRTESPRSKEQERYPVRRIAVHERMHPDELVSLILLYRAGEQHFPGVREVIEKRELEYWPFGSGTPDQKPAHNWLKKRGVLPVGVGNGIFDEHLTEKKNGQELKEECSATLVAKYLGIENQGWIKKILRYAQVNDTQGCKAPLEFGHLLKLFYRRFSTDAEMHQVEDFGLGVLETKIAAEESGRKSFRPKNQQSPHGILPDEVETVYMHPHFTVEDAIAYLMLQKKGQDGAKLRFCTELPEDPGKHIAIGLGDGPLAERAAKQASHLLNLHQEIQWDYLMQYAKRERSGKAVHPFELVALLQDHHSVFKDPFYRLEWVLNVLDTVYWSQGKLKQAVEELKQQLSRRQVFLETLPGAIGEDITILAMRSENFSIGRVLRGKYSPLRRKIDVFIQETRVSRMIFINNERIRSHDTAAVWRRIEQEKRGAVTQSDWNVLHIEGAVDGLEHIYLQPQTQFVLNGSESHPDTLKTKLSLQELFNAAKIGYGTEMPCEKKKCTNRKCPLYRFGLSRCRKFRWEQAVKK